jgi:hypothetical protein
MRHSIFLRIKAWLFGGELVLLRGSNLEVFPSIAYPDGFGNKYAYVYPNLNVGHCCLLPDGTIHEKSGAYYIKEWKPL